MDNDNKSRRPVPGLQPRRLVLVGSVLVDILMYMQQLPERGGDCIAQRTLLTTGGGFNILAGATRLGMPVAYAGRVGNGPMGQQVTADLAAAQIPLMLSQVVGEDSGFDIGLIDADAERTFITSPGTESRLSNADVDSIKLLPGDAVYVSGYDLCYPVSGATLGQWLPNLGPHQLLVLDPGPLAAEIPADRLACVLARTDILSLNAREAQLLTGKTDLQEAAIQLVAGLAPDGWVIARDGAEGCWVVDRNQHIRHIPARPARVIDTTGAGDAHVATLLTQLASGLDMYRAAQIANVAASISVERSGPATSPNREELLEALKAYNMQ